MAITIIEKEVEVVLKKYPGFIYNKESGMLFGILNVDNEGEDCYDVDINLNTYPGNFPLVKESGRIPQKPHRHINGDGTCCFTTKAKEQILMRKQIKSLLDFIQRIIIPFLRNNSYYEINKCYKNGEYHHGIPGIIEGYKDILKISDNSLLVNLLIARSKKIKIEKNKVCFCGSKKKVKDCHLHCYTDLFHIEDDVIKNDLANIQNYINVVTQTIASID